MWEILNVLRRLGRGESKAAIAAATSHSRSTIRRYERLALKLGWTPRTGEPSEDLAGAISRRVHPAADRGTGPAEAQLLPHQRQLREWLTPGPTEKRGLRLTKVHQLLLRQGIGVPYSSVYRFVKHRGYAERRRITVRMAEPSPGELAEVDFGLGAPPLNAQQSSDFYEVIIERHRRASTVITSNRAIEEMDPALFDDPILAQSALDRLAHNGHQVVVDGPSYRSRQRPGQTVDPPRKIKRK